MGRKGEEWQFILPEAKLDYTLSQINTFVEMWNEGHPIRAFAEKYNINIYEAGLLVIHCELYGLIQPREGGLSGTKTHKWKIGQGNKSCAGKECSSYGE